MISFVYAYYDNPGMLAKQYELWSSYPDYVRKNLEVIVVDDGSPNSPAIQVPRPDKLPRFRMFRVLKDMPWHQDGARNLGAHMSIYMWLFLCDIDHMMPQETLEKLMVFLKTQNVEENYFTFGRIEVDGKPTLDKYGNVKPGRNILCMSKPLYWKAGGYDEDFCGYYGTDGMFLKRVGKHSTHRYLGMEFPVIRVSTKTVPDCNTRTLERKGARNDQIKKNIEQFKKRSGRSKVVSTLAFKWKEELCIPHYG